MSAVDAFRHPNANPERDAIKDEHVPTSAEVLDAMYEKYGPIHGPDYDQEGAMRRGDPKFVLLQARVAENDAKTPLPLIWAGDAGPLLDASYVIKGVIAPGELIVVYGQPKSGKTFLTTDLGYT